MSDCIFCKIVKGDIPSYIIYEDDDFKVILDRFPSSVGHTLIIPKNHADDIYGLSDEVCEKLFPLAAKIAKKLREGLSPDGLNILQNNGETAGQSVLHFHMHLIPRYKKDNVTIKWGSCNPEEVEFEKILTVLLDKS